MPVTREARYLSGVDLGKTVTVHHVKSGRIWREGALTRVEHRQTEDGPMVVADLAGAPYTISLQPSSPVTITGKAS